MSTPNKTVLLMAYGSPESVDEVADYYTHIRHGVRPSEERIQALENRYRSLGGKTPLLAVTRAQAAALQRLLDERQGPGVYSVNVGMKHWHPFIHDVLREVADRDPAGEVIALALAPHYSKISIGGYAKALEEGRQGLSIKMIEHWHTNAYLIDCISEQLKEVLTLGAHIIFTAHSLPEKIREWNDPYEEQLLETSRLIAARFPEHTWTFSFQSAGHTPDPWLGPDISAHLTDLKGRGTDNVLVCPIGFVADNLEILFDIDVTAKKTADELGMKLARTQSRNIHPLFIEALYDVVVNR